MGPYLSAPITDKESTEGSSGRIRYGATHMQGWRNTMEDAHVTNMALPGGSCDICAEALCGGVGEKPEVSSGRD